MQAQVHRTRLIKILHINNYLPLNDGLTIWFMYDGREVNDKTFKGKNANSRRISVYVNFIYYSSVLNPPVKFRPRISRYTLYIIRLTESISYIYIFETVLRLRKSYSAVCTLFCIPRYRNLSRIAPLTVHWHGRERGARNAVSSNAAIKPI